MKLCKDCPHFHIDFEPLRGGFDLGRASCDKYNLVTDFVNRRKFNTLECVKLKCVEEEQHERDS